MNSSSRDLATTAGIALETALSLGQQRMLLASDPDDITRKEGVGVELRTGADYAVAKALTRRGLGEMTGPGGFLPGMYWNNLFGLALRGLLLSSSAMPAEGRGPGMNKNPLTNPPSREGRDG